MEPETADYKSFLRGDTINARKFTLTQTLDGSTSPVDLSGAKIRVHFVLNSRIVKKALGNGITILDSANGKFRIDRFQLPEAGTWVYDVEIVFPGETVKTWVKGSIKIVDDTTK